LLSGGGPPTGTQAQLVVALCAPGAGGKAGAGKPVGDRAKQFSAQ
jgi:hypothetical protein